MKESMMMCADLRPKILPYRRTWQVMCTSNLLWNTFNFLGEGTIAGRLRNRSWFVKSSYHVKECSIDLGVQAARDVELASLRRTIEELESRCKKLSGEREAPVGGNKYAFSICTTLYPANHNFKILGRIYKLHAFMVIRLIILQQHCTSCWRHILARVAKLKVSLTMRILQMLRMFHLR